MEIILTIKKYKFAFKKTLLFKPVGSIRSLEEFEYKDEIKA